MQNTRAAISAKIPLYIAYEYYGWLDAIVPEPVMRTKYFQTWVNSLKILCCAYVSLILTLLVAYYLPQEGEWS